MVGRPAPWSTAAAGSPLAMQVSRTGTVLSESDTEELTEMTQAYREITFSNACSYNLFLLEETQYERRFETRSWSSEKVPSSKLRRVLKGGFRNKKLMK